MKITHLCASYFVVYCSLSIVMDPTPFLLSDMGPLAKGDLGGFQWSGQTGNRGSRPAACPVLCQPGCPVGLRLTLVPAANNVGLQVVSVFVFKELANS